MSKNRRELIDPDELGLKFMFDLPNPVIVTHGDVDGLTAAALLIREFRLNKIDVPIFISQPFSLHNILKKIGDNGYNIIIVDLNLTDRSFSVLPRGSVLIDHHPGSERYIGEFKDRHIWYLIDTSKSASQLCRSLVSDSKFNDYLARLGAVGDKLIYDPRMGKEVTFLSAAMALRHSDDSFRMEVIREFINGRHVMEIDEVKDRAREMFSILDRVRNEGECLFNGDNIVLKFYNDGFSMASALASRLVKDTGKVGLVLTRMDERHYLITGRVPESLRDVFDMRDFIDAVGGNGGGLPQAASCTIESDKFSDLIACLEDYDNNLR